MDKGKVAGIAFADDDAGMKAMFESSPMYREFVEGEKQFVAALFAEIVKKMGKTRMGHAAAYRVLMDQTDDLLRQIDEGPGLHPACGAGCWWCCTKPVAVTGPEVVLLADWIAEEWTEEQKAALMQRCEDYKARVAGTPQIDWVHKRARCPLLGEDNLCTAYEYRPLICRGYNSLDAGVCETGYNMSWGEGAPLYEQIYDRFVVAGVPAGLMDVLFARAGLTTTNYNLALALGRIVPMGLQGVMAWLQGEDVLAGTEYGSDAPREVLAERKAEMYEKYGQSDTQAGQA